MDETIKQNIYERWSQERQEWELVLKVTVIEKRVIATGKTLAEIEEAADMARKAIEKLELGVMS